MVYCNSTNTESVDQSSFWSDGTTHWDAHRIGWAVAGGCALLTTIITWVHINLHLLNYYKPLEQRQVVRILMMPWVYAIISFFSYRFFRSYTYYSVAETSYEALTIAAFLMLLILFIGESNEDQARALLDKDKRKMPFPLNCFRMRPGKPYFLYLMKWSVLQYSFIEPLITIAAIICEAYNVLCPQEYSVHFAEVYLDSVDFVSISVALYGLITFYVFMKDNLKGRKPLAKFLSIKLIVFFTYYQSWVFSVLQNYNVIKGTEFWTATNVVDGLTALCTCIEMVFFSILMFYAFSYKEYSKMRDGQPHTNPFKSLIHSLNYWDFICEFGATFVFFWRFIRHKQGTRLSPEEVKRLHSASSNSVSQSSPPINSAGTEYRPAEKEDYGSFKSGFDIHRALSLGSRREGDGEGVRLMSMVGNGEKGGSLNKKGTYSTKRGISEDMGEATQVAEGKLESVKGHNNVTPNMKDTV